MTRQEQPAERTATTRPVARVVVVDHTAELAGGEVALARLLEAIDRRRFDVRVLLLADGPLVRRLRDQGTTTAVLPAPPELTGVSRTRAVSSPLALARNAWRTLALVGGLTRAIRGSGAELVVANTLKAAVLTALAAPLAGRRWVWHVHDRIAEDYLPRPLVSGLRLLARLAPRMVVANSLATRATLPAVPEHRIVVAYPGVDPAGISPDPALRPDPDAPPVFGLLGRIAPTKGQSEFLHAAALLAERQPLARFSVIGDALFNDGAFAEEMRRLPAALGIAERVEFTGWADDPVAAVSGLTALVHASPVPEPFGQVLVEAMLAGVPVIGSAAGGVPEIVDPDHDGTPLGDGVQRTALGLLAEPGNERALAVAMEWAARHPGELGAMAERARTSAAARFDIHETARRVEAAWARALGVSAGG